MPLDAWLLLVVSVGLGLSLEVVFYASRRGDATGSAGPLSDRSE